MPASLWVVRTFVSKRWKYKRNVAGLPFFLFADVLRCFWQIRVKMILISEKRGRDRRVVCVCLCVCVSGLCLRPGALSLFCLFCFGGNGPGGAFSGFVSRVSESNMSFGTNNCTGMLSALRG